MIRNALAALLLAALPTPAAAEAAPVPDPLAEALGQDEPARTRELSTRVVNGVPAKEGKYPFLVQLTFDVGGGYVGRCGGAHIAPGWILTAAHCLVTIEDGEERRRVEPGQAQARRGSIRLDAGDRLAIRRVVVHPDYSRPHAIYNDIALLELERPVAAPLAELPPAGYDPPAGLPVRIVGWGKQSADEKAGSAATLREAKTDLVSRATCEEIHEAVRQAIREKNPGYQGNGPIDRSRICAEVSARTKLVDSCQGDSGGPLLTPTRDGFVAVGVVSYGYSCALPDIHGVYTNVAHYRDWIDATIGAQRPKPAPAPAPTPEPGPPAIAPDDGLVDLVAVEGAAPVALTLRGGASAPPGEPLVFEIVSPVGGALRLFDVALDGAVTQIFPNHRTERARVSGTIRPGGRFVTPTDRHAFRFLAPDAPGERMIYAVVTPEGAGGAALVTRGLGPIERSDAYLDAMAALFRDSCGPRAGACGIGVVRLVVE